MPYLYSRMIGDLAIIFSSLALTSSIWSTAPSKSLWAIRTSRSSGTSRSPSPDRKSASRVSTSNAETETCGCRLGLGLSFACWLVPMICKSLPIESLIHCFPGRVVRDFWFVHIRPIEKVALWMDLLYLRPGSETDEGLWKNCPNRDSNQEFLIQCPGRYPLSHCISL